MLDRSGKMTMILAAVNLLAMLAMLGTFIYTKKIYKRPPITETEEREKLAEQEQEKEKYEEGVNSTIEFRAFTVNIQPTVHETGPDHEGPLPPPKLHYARMAFTMNINNAEVQPEFDEIRTQFMDSLIQIMGGKSFKELNTVQGRYILRNDILELANRLVEKPFVTDVFFTDFILQ